MTRLRIIGDVHGQIDLENLITRHARPYEELIAGASHSIQVGDMGDGETYDHLIAHVDAARHRFFPGNHDHYNRLPPHSLGDFGPACWGGVDFFFVRGAASADQEKLVRLGRQLGKTLWFEQEELTDEQMQAAQHAYVQAQPRIMLSHDAPTHVARLATQHARRFNPPNPEATFVASRTTDFLERLLQHHQPRLWIFGHHHHNWRFREDETLFMCVGELSYFDVDELGAVRGP
jgi:hypothetical protein